MLPRNPPFETAPSTPALGPKRNISSVQQQPPPANKRGGRSIQTITQGLMNVGRSAPEGKKTGLMGTGKRG